MSGLKITPLVVSETDQWVALNKPAGLLSIPDREGKEISLKALLKEKYSQIYTVHRLDRDTSGLIIFAKDAASHQQLSVLFEERKTVKIYQGLVIGTLPEKQGRLEFPIAEHPVKKGMMTVHRQGKPSLTEFGVLEEFGKYSWVQFNIHTGRTHQIRVHMKEYGNPIACDPLYGDGKPIFVSGIRNSYKLSKALEEERPILDRLALHSFQLSFTWNNEEISLEAPVPKDIRATLQQLQKSRR